MNQYHSATAGMRPQRAVNEDAAQLSVTEHDPRDADHDRMSDDGCPHDRDRAH